MPSRFTTIIVYYTVNFQSTLVEPVRGAMDGADPSGTDDETAVRIRVALPISNAPNRHSSAVAQSLRTLPLYRQLTQRAIYRIEGSSPAGLRGLLIMWIS